MTQDIRPLSDIEVGAVFGGDNPQPSCSSGGGTTSCSCPPGYAVTATIDLSTGDMTITCEPA